MALMAAGFIQKRLHTGDGDHDPNAAGTGVLRQRCAGVLLLSQL